MRCPSRDPRPLLRLVRSLSAQPAELVLQRDHRSVQYRFELYDHRFEDGQQVIYFWNPQWLETLGATTQVYPPDSLALGTYAAVCQAMAGYLSDHPFDTLHMHDYHVALIPFYLNAPTRTALAIASDHPQRGISGRSFDRQRSRVARASGSGRQPVRSLFPFLWQHQSHVAGMICTHQSGGKVTTVSGDLDATWGYARDLTEPDQELIRRVRAAHPQLNDLPEHQVRERIYLPAQGLKELHEISVIGITNGIADDNKAQQLPWLKAQWVSRHKVQFRHPEVQREMAQVDHNFSATDLSNKQRLKRLAHLEAFGGEPSDQTVLLAVVGRMAQQKGLDLVAGIMGDVRRRFPEAKFVVLGTAPSDDLVGQQTVEAFQRATRRDPAGVFFRNDFDMALSKLLLAGSDFSFIPSRFEPCGIVDYESALLGTLVIGRLTGGLAKVRDVSFLYSWHDPADKAGEREALLAATFDALTVFYQDPQRLLSLRRAAMSLDGSWSRSAHQYLRMYQAGRIARRFLAGIDEHIARFSANCTSADAKLLLEFLRSGSGQQRISVVDQLRQQVAKGAGTV